MGWLWSDASSQARILYIYLDRTTLAALLAAGELEPHRKVFDHRPLRLAPLVWLTDDLVPTSPAAWITARTSAAVISVRLTVATSAAQRWPSWAARNRVSRHARRRIERVADGLGDRLWVTPAGVHSSQWISAEDVETGAVLWRGQRYGARTAW